VSVLYHIKIFKKSNFRYTRLIPFRVLRVSGAQLSIFASAVLCQRPHYKVAAVVSRCQGVEKIDLLWIRTPNLPHQKQTYYN